MISETRSTVTRSAPVDSAVMVFVRSGPIGTPPNSGPKLFLQSFQLVRVSGTGGWVWEGARPLPRKKLVRVSGRGGRVWGGGLPLPRKKILILIITTL